MTTGTEKKSSSGWLKRAISMIALILTMDAFLFGVAGRLDWWGAWLFTGLYLLFLAIVVVWTSLKAPGLLEERSHRAENVKPWDKAITTVYTALLIGLLIIAALDAGRYRWAAMPWYVQLIGMGVLVFCGVILWKIITVNYYLSSYARIQDDRGQTVVSDGPYRFVRHPMYAVLILFMFGVALMLGSGWALIPAGLIGFLMILRTSLEDRMLQAELPGYREYAQKVRFRLFPRIW